MPLTFLPKTIFDPYTNASYNASIEGWIQTSDGAVSNSIDSTPNYKLRLKSRIILAEQHLN